MKNSFEVAVIGGGVTGASIGYGIAKKAISIVLFDDVPSLSRASRANTGLVWCQSKGKGKPAYSRWSFMAAQRYADYAQELLELSGINTGFKLSGGLTPVLGESGFTSRLAYIKAMREQNINHDFPVEMLERHDLEKLLPKVPFGPEVTGASYCAQEGYLGPLELLFALRKSFTRIGGKLYDGCRVTRVEHKGQEYQLATTKGHFSAQRLVIAAGLGSMKLGSQLGCRIPVSPNGGHKILFERVPDILPIPLHNFLRTTGGTLFFGTEHDPSWNCTDTAIKSMARNAALAMRFWPSLGNLKVIRSWFGLRVWPDDGFPIYDKLPNHDKAFIFAMHSAVTQSSMLQKEAADFVMGEPLPEYAPDFSLRRFSNLTIPPSDKPSVCPF